MKIKIKKKEERIIDKNQRVTITRCMQFWESAQRSIDSTSTNLQFIVDAVENDINCILCVLFLFPVMR